MLFNGNSAIAWLYHGENKLIFNEMVMGRPLTETDDIERMRQHRNIIAHNTDFKISDSDFNVIWLELSQVCPSFCIFFSIWSLFQETVVAAISW